MFFFLSQHSADHLKAPGEAEAELAYLNSVGIIDAVLSDDINTFLFGAKMVICKCALGSPSCTNPLTLLNLAQVPPSHATASSKLAFKNADGHMDGNHLIVYTSADILIGLLSGSNYH